MAITVGELMGRLKEMTPEVIFFRYRANTRASKKAEALWFQWPTGSTRSPIEDVVHGPYSPRLHTFEDVAIYAQGEGHVPVPQHL
jgi:hypothetical protein